ncbi:hypothetical protein AUK57_00935 [Candidatus Saccharibacteria bacterium CG2_30_41_52]|nr:ATP-binding protein [Candidatus Saccharibacteria bacterium]OIP86322.1 MAG: hypothetical protein AUK57_00935 [Candidatus Saccharibacteria bacterium CG2_30_41_52]
MKPLSLSKPHVIVTVGIPGSGKSFFAEHFAATFKAPLISGERIRKELFGDKQRSDEQTAISNKITNYLLEEVLKTGRTIVLDSQTDLRSERAVITKKSRDYDYDPLFIWVQTEPTTAKKRATKSNLTADQFESKLKRFSAPHIAEKPIVISGKHTYSSQMKIVLKHLVEPRSHAIEPIVPTRPMMTRNKLIR